VIGQRSKNAVPLLELRRSSSSCPTPQSGPLPCLCDMHRNLPDMDGVSEKNKRKGLPPVRMTRATFETGEPMDLDLESHSPPTPTTPSAAETYNGLRRSLSMAALGELPIEQVQRKLWRPQGERRRRPRDLDQLITHTVRGGVRQWFSFCSSAAFTSS
jgi:hypothetical protein